MRLKFRVASIAALIIVAAAFAVPALAHSSAKTFTVTATEFKFKLSAASAPKGTVIFNVVNKGKIPHDFKIAGKKTPMLKPGKSAKLSVTLKAGSFKYLCTVPGHAALGMKGTLKVK